MTVTTDERAAFTELFRDHHGPIHALLLGRTSDPDTARDLLQETFLRAWRSFDELVDLPPQRQRAWLFTVARNLVVDGYRSASTGRATLAAVAGDPRTHDHGRDAADETVARDELARVDHAIARLPDDERTIITMSVVAGLTSVEIGEALDLPAGTVRSKLHQARSRLHTVLEVPA
jgi:RNA polymerase sigma-70 factor, ECF subfamily